MTRSSERPDLDSPDRKNRLSFALEGDSLLFSVYMKAKVSRLKKIAWIPIITGTGFVIDHLNWIIHLIIKR